MDDFLIIVFGVWFGTLVFSHVVGNAQKKKLVEEESSENARQEKIDALYGRKTRR